MSTPTTTNAHTTDTPKATPMVDPSEKKMDDIVALCKRRGFVFPASEIYGGINGFWDYGPLGTTLKNTLRDRWWRDMVAHPPDGPPEMTDGSPLEIVGVDSAIIQNPKVWEASGHVGGFNDPMVDDTETKNRFRADHLYGVFLQEHAEAPSGPKLASAAISYKERAAKLADSGMPPAATVVANNLHEAFEVFVSNLKTISKAARLPSINVKGGLEYTNAQDRDGRYFEVLFAPIPLEYQEQHHSDIRSPFTQKRGVLTEPREFNLMFETYIGAIKDENAKAYLRPETAQGIFLNFKNVLDTMRVRVPFGIAQIGKAFRNEVTPRNFIFRSREFEQMEMEWFCHPDESSEWYEYWVEKRLNWWKSLGIDPRNLQRREHEQDELAHYSTVCADVEYKYPFTAPGFGELEGIAHRGCFDLTQHQEHSKTKLEYFDQARNEKYIPHVIEPASGLTRGVLVLLCEAYTPDESRPSKVVMRFDPKLAPIQAAVFPLVNKDGMPEKAEGLFKQLRSKYRVQFDVKQNIGKRYARMDEAGTPYCFTIDGQTFEDNTVTVRDRDTTDQQRVNIDQVENFLAERVGV